MGRSHAIQQFSRCTFLSPFVHHLFTPGRFGLSYIGRLSDPCCIPIRHSFPVSHSPPESHAEHRVLMVSWLRPIPSTFFLPMCICPFPPRPHIPSHNPFTVAVSTRTCCSPCPIIAMSPHIRFRRSLFSAHVPSCIISYLTHITISTTIVLSLRTRPRIASRTHCTLAQILKSKETLTFPFMPAR